MSYKIKTVKKIIPRIYNVDQHFHKDQIWKDRWIIRRKPNFLYSIGRGVIIFAEFWFREICSNRNRAETIFLPPMCNGIFRKFPFKTHIRIHMREKPYSCEMCRSSFLQITCLKKDANTHGRENILLWRVSIIFFKEISFNNTCANTHRRETLFLWSVCIIIFTQNTSEHTQKRTLSFAWCVNLNYTFL